MDGKAKRIEVSVVSSMDDLIKAIAIRACVYVGENHWTFSEEWDGNDFSATHLIATVDGEAAGTVRIRYFGDFAKPERMAVLPQFRQKRYGEMGVAFALGRYAFDFCRKKGFTKFYGHALEDKVKFWSRFGYGKFEPMGPAFDCAGKPVIPMIGHLDLPEDALSLDSGHLVLVRREGAWDTPGFYERAAAAKAQEKTADDAA